MESIPANPILEFQPDTLENVRKLYNLDSGRMIESVDSLDEWAKKQVHFIKKDFSRHYLETTIISCKGSVEKAKKQIDKICTFKSLLPKFFIDCNVKRDLKSITDLACCLPLPKMTPDYHRIFVVKLYDRPFTSSSLMEYFRLIFIISEYLKANDYGNGFIIIDDYRELNLMDLMSKMNLVELQQFMTILTEGFGARLKGIHILSQSKLVDVFITTIKPMLSSKVGSRLHVYSTLEELHGIVDKQLLPADYGGEERSIDKLQKDWIDILSTEEHEKYMSLMNKACTDESRRQTDTFNNQYMGTPGTFRSLTVD